VFLGSAHVSELRKQWLERLVVPPSVFALFLVVFGFTSGEFVVAGILPDVAAGLGVSIPAAGLLTTAYALGMIVGGPVLTVLTARAPRKPLVVVLVAVSVLANLGSAAAPGYAVLLVARFAAGLVVATFFAIAIATAVAVAPAGRQASAVARVALGMNLGIVLGAPLGTIVGQQLGWRATFAAVAAVTLAAVPLVLRYLPSAPGATGSVLAELRVLGDRDVQLAIALTAVGNVGVVTVFTYIAPLLTGVSGFPPAAVRCR
jgi:DHA1 family inner membrane transport protein